MSVSHPVSRRPVLVDDFKLSTQFLNSVLSTIGEDGQQNSFSRPTQLQPKANNPAASASPKSDVAPPRHGGALPCPKRKAEDELPTPAAKAPKVELGQRQSNGISLMRETSSSKGIMKPTISTTKSALAVPYRGTSRPSPTSASPDTPRTDASRPAPKKGSYAEIMARASANNKPSIGVIKHKPKEAISAKKEIMMRKKGLLARVKGEPKDTRDGPSTPDKDNSLSSSAHPRNPTLSGKKSSQPSYKGTAAPKPQPAYKGTMKPRSAIDDTARRKDSRNDRSRSSSTNPPRRARDYESEDGEDDVDEEEFYSEESDDMEAGFSDVEEEETAATKAAKKEDEEQLRIENQLKKEKEDRKKKLAALAAKAPKPKY
ncbi:MAG: hypothetical protein Q9219_002566 [cf. Caloplaca sp. 3 TL-2023]